MTIGERAVLEIKERAKLNGRTITAELNLANLHIDSYSGWKRCEQNPSAYYLQQMALHGYDIYYILTGERHTNET